MANAATSGAKRPLPQMLIKRRRQTLRLTVPKPTRKGNIKVTYEGWLAAARHALIEEGFAAVKVDRLAPRLKVTRGSFYRHFKKPADLLDAVLALWERENLLAPTTAIPATPAAALVLLQQITGTVITEQQFDPRFDMAVRDWARVSPEVDQVVHRVDEARMHALRRMFLGFGFDEHEAVIRARVFYYHQIGYYALGVHEDKETRLANLPTYMAVLCGQRYLDALASAAQE